MSLNRLKRQDFHTCVCITGLFALWTAAFYLTGQPAREAVLFLIVQTAAGAAFGAFRVGIRRGKDLALRLLCASTLAFAVTAAAFGSFSGALLLFAAAQLAGLAWLAAAKAWMRHELCPGWTMLVYDTENNREKADRIAESNKDLIAPVCCIRSTDEKEIEAFIRTFRLPQVMICLEKGNDRLLAFCRKAGITAFVDGNITKKGLDTGRDGLVYVRPVPAFRKPSFQCKGGAAKK